MNVALLGLGNVGRAVYDILTDDDKIESFKETINIKYIFVRNKSKYLDIPSNLLETEFQKIIADESIDTIIEMMGSSISYQCIKEALERKINVITANKEVIAESYYELQKIAKKNNVNLLFEASVGGGIPIVHTLLNCCSYNDISQITGILNGTTNYILTSMHKNHMTFKEALKLAQSKGFAEADPTADLEGLDMVRKIAILSMIAYNSKISIDNVYHYGIKMVTKEIVEIIELLGYKLKFVASSINKKDSISLAVEPVIFKSDELLANVDYEYNYVSYLGKNCATQTMSGKGAGPVTANSIIFDLNLLSSGYTQDFIPKLEKVCKENNLDTYRYFVMTNSILNPKVIEKNFKEFIITKKINRNELKSILKDAIFYAKINE